MAFIEPKKWCEWLPGAEWWYNSSYHTAIKMSPFEALYEYPHPHLGAAAIPSNISPEAHQTLIDRGNMLQVLQQNLSYAQKAMKKHADKHRTETFSVGEMVYLKMIPQHETTLGRQNPRKLSSKWYGPFRILQTVGTRAYKLQLPASSQLHNVFHINQLKKHLGPNVVPNHSLPLITATGKIKTFPIAILQRRLVPRYVADYDVAVAQWVIKWDSLPEEEAT
jgi:hypothetical protein